MQLLTSRRGFSKCIDRKRTPSRSSQEVLSLIADEKRKGNMTGAQAEALQKYLAYLYLSEYLQAALEPYVEEFVEKTQQRLEDKFDDLLEDILHLEWE